LPLAAFNFGALPTFGIPATLLIMPVVPVIIMGGLLTGLLAAIWTPLGWLAGWAPALAGWYAAGVPRVFAALPGATVDVGRLDAWLVWGYYLLLAGSLAFVRRRRWWPSPRQALQRIWAGPSRGRLVALALAATLLVAALPWALAAARSDDLLQVRFLDVGQGDAVLIQAPSGATVLIDGRRDPPCVMLPLADGLLAGPGVDLAVFSHAHADHLNGLMGLARRGGIELALVPPEVPGGSGAWRAELVQLGIPLV
jgi:competence protein ComEC